MAERSFLLRFECRSVALSALEAAGMAMDPDTDEERCADGQPASVCLAFGDGTIKRPTGETASFEGEPMAMTETEPGYHLVVRGMRQLPQELLAFVVEGAEDASPDP
jgi:hypothetical protein